MSEATFTLALSLVREHEGGYSNDANDPGGETKYGISRRAHPELDIANLTWEQAAAIYRQDYWLPVKGDELPPCLAVIVFDAAVNQGVKAAIRMLQRVLRVEQDGMIGPATIKAAQRDPAEATFRFAAARAMRYAVNDNVALYGMGWYYRLCSVLANAVLLLPTAPTSKPTSEGG